MHRGHLDAIMRAKKENDKVYVIVCGYDNEERAGNINMTLKERTAIVRKIFRNDEIIKVLTINDTELGIDESMSKETWIVWQNKVAELLYSTLKYDDKIMWYVAVIALSVAVCVWAAVGAEDFPNVVNDYLM